MNKIEEIANMLLQKRGYITVCSVSSRKIGDTVNEVRAHGFGYLKHKVTIIARTTREDHMEQARIAGNPDIYLDPDVQYNFYRAVAE